MRSETSLGRVSWFYYMESAHRDLRTTEQKLVSDYYFKEEALPPLNRAMP